MRFFSDAAALLALAAALAFAGCSPPKTKGPSPITFYFTCDTDGRLEPCGCFTGQFGGLSRLKQYLALQPADRPLLSMSETPLRAPKTTKSSNIDICKRPLIQ